MSTVPGPVHTVPEEQCSEELVSESNKVKDLRCEQVKEEESEAVYKDECGDGDEGTVIATEQCYTQYEEEC